MDILQIVLFGIVASILYIILKDTNETFAFLIILMTSIIIFLTIIQQIRSVFMFIERIAYQSNVQNIHLQTILKIIGIAYITEIGANMTKDAGLSSVSSKIELAGKIAIILLAIPILTAVIEAILNVIPTT
ncbi:MAG TPA: stage III sporulation protein AD [Bacillota bacterium]|nr:stage III sporulation protein AD [Bacillota bacterium]